MTHLYLILNLWHVSKSVPPVLPWSSICNQIWRSQKDRLHSYSLWAQIIFRIVGGLNLIRIILWQTFCTNWKDHRRTGYICVSHNIQFVLGSNLFWRPVITEGQVTYMCLSQLSCLHLPWVQICSEVVNNLYDYRRTGYMCVSQNFHDIFGSYLLWNCPKAFWSRKDRLHVY